MKQLIQRHSNHYNLNDLINKKGDLQYLNIIYKKQTKP